MALVQFPRILAPVSNLLSVVFNVHLPAKFCSSEFPPESSMSLRGLATNKANSRSWHCPALPLSGFEGV